MAEITTEGVDPRRKDKKVASLGEGTDSEREEFPLPSLLTERDAKRPVITLFFTKSPVKMGTEKDK